MQAQFVFRPMESSLDMALPKIERQAGEGPGIIRAKEFKAERLDAGHINVGYQLDDGNFGLIETSGHVDSEE